MQAQSEKPQRSLYTHKYAIHFDILPEISYLNQEFPLLIADFLQLFDGFPQGVEITEKSVDEGLDFCRVVFSVCSESPDDVKTFGNWFQAIFRDPLVAEILERLVACALDEPNEAEVILTDWTRLAN